MVILLLRRCGVSLMVLLTVIFAFTHSLAYGAEADWVYQTANFMERFERIGASQASPLNRQTEYLTLLDDCAKFSSAPAESERAGRAKKVAYLWMQRLVNEQIGNATAMQRAAEDYAKEKAALPESERGIALILERSEAGEVAYAPRVCKVEPTGNSLDIVAVDYPIRELLGEIGKAAKVNIDIPVQVSGLVDFTFKGGDTVDRALFFLAKPRGLWVKGSVADGFKVSVVDPLYDVSLAKRSETLTPHANTVQPDKGITTGYVIIRGCYVRPPYLVEVKRSAKQAEVCVNGAALASFALSREEEQPVTIPTGEQFATGGKLGMYAGQQYATLKKQYGHEEAIRRVVALIKTQTIVKSVETRPGLIIFTTTAGRTHNVAIDSFTPTTDAKESQPAKDTGSGADSKSAPLSSDTVQTQRLAEVEDCRARVVKTLTENGLVLVPNRRPPMLFGGKEAELRLLAISSACAECERQKDAVAATVFVDDWRDGASDWAWEILLNSDYRLLQQRLAVETAAARQASDDNAK